MSDDQSEDYEEPAGRQAIRTPAAAPARAVRQPGIDAWLGLHDDTQLTLEGKGNLRSCSAAPARFDALCCAVAKKRGRKPGMRNTVLLTRCCSHSGHTMLLTRCCSQSGHTMLLTQCCSLSAAYTVLLTQCCSHSAAHTVLLTRCCSHGAAHTVLLTQCCSHSAAHTVLLTQCCSHGAAHTVLTNAPTSLLVQ
jgi:hypothetical protein